MHGTQGQQTKEKVQTHMTNSLELIKLAKKRKEKEDRGKKKQGDNNIIYKVFHKVILNQVFRPLLWVSN